MALALTVLSLGQTLSFALIISLSFVLKLGFWTQFAWASRPTLSKIPGPRLAAWTRWWMWRVIASGRCNEVFVDLNKKYGSLARIGPNHLLTSDPDFMRSILAARSPYLRGPWFDALRIDPQNPNVVSERDEEKHVKLRAKLTPSFKGKSLQTIESVIDQRCVDFCQRLKSNIKSQPNHTLKIDAGKQLEYLSLDIITKACLGHELGCVAINNDKHGFLNTVESGQTMCEQLAILPEITKLLSWLTRIPFIKSLVTPNCKDSTGPGRIMGIIQQILQQRDSEEHPSRDGMLNSWLRNGVPAEEIDTEMVVTLVAGAETTATAMRSILLAIILHPQVYRKLKDEIHEAVQRRLVSTPIKNSEARHLPYLQACILEGLRKHPPLSQLRERVVPPAGDIVKGHRIPGGTYIGLNTWGTQLNDIFGDDAEVFRPERWFIDDEDHLKAMHQTHDLIFGHGSSKCIGQAMAMIELNKIIFELLRDFDIMIADPFRPWSSKCHGIFFQKDFNIVLTESALYGLPTYDESQHL